MLIEKFHNGLVPICFDRFWNFDFLRRCLTQLVNAKWPEHCILENCKRICSLPNWIGVRQVCFLVDVGGVADWSAIQHAWDTRDRSKPVRSVFKRPASVIEIVNLHQMLQIPDRLCALRMTNKVKLLFWRPASRHAIWECVDVIQFFPYLAQVLGSVARLKFCMTLVEMFSAVNNSRKLRARTISRQSCLASDLNDSYQLLIQFAGSVVDTLNRPNICLKYFSMASHIWDICVVEVVAEDWWLIRSPPKKPMHENYGKIVLYGWFAWDLSKKFVFLPPVDE